MKLLIVLALVSGSAFGQVSVYTDPDADAIVFETGTGTTITVEPWRPGEKVSIPSGYGYDSTFIVSPGGYATRTYEVNEDE